MKNPRIRFSLRTLLLLPVLFAATWYVGYEVPRQTANRFLNAIAEGRFSDADSLLSDCVIQNDKVDGHVSFIAGDQQRPRKSIFAASIDASLLQGMAAECAVDERGRFEIATLKFDAKFGFVTVTR